ncbi:DUF4253 domain-containing protein [Parasphingorhabdus pacifica]
MLREDRESNPLADLSALLGGSAGVSVALPPGELLAEQSTRIDGDAPKPLCWISDEPPPAQLIAALRADRNSGLWPLLLCDDNEVYGERCTVGVVPPEPREHIDRWNAADVMTRIWDGLCRSDDGIEPAYDLDSLEPFRDVCPGLTRPGNLLADPDILANQQTHRFIDHETRLALVPAQHGADVLAVLGWSGAANHVSRTAGLSAMLRSWENRFGARLLRLGPDRVDVSVSAPPQEAEHARAVAAEHWAFCPDRIMQESGSLIDHANEIRGRRTWSFWWD